MIKSATVALALLAAPLLVSMPAAAAQGNAAAAPATQAAPAAAAATTVTLEASKPLDWESWKAGNDVADLASLQRGARNFMNYCVGCHGLKYERYQRMATDLKIPTSALTKYLITTGDGPLDYINTNMPAADSATWFGKTPPDLSLMVSARSPDYIYRFLKTFYADPTRPTGSNNLALASAAMPAVLSSLSGVKEAVYRDVKVTTDGKTTVEKQFDHFETVVPGTMTAAQFDGFVRDTVNFLDYVSEPDQVERRSMGIWVVLFLLVFTGFAWLLKREYWKKVH